MSYICPEEGYKHVGNSFAIPTIDSTTDFGYGGEISGYHTIPNVKVYDYDYKLHLLHKKYIADINYINEMFGILADEITHVDLVNSSIELTIFDHIENMYSMMNIDTHLHSVVFRNVHIRHSEFITTSFSDVEFDNALFEKCRFEDCVFDRFTMKNFHSGNASFTMLF